ncbi:uncharacterized protein LOC125946172 [Dermacentor silvarum]|uniref:uncharacterized protein LOC125946172 n=1 Tax=Dermacentor silvarum TaxID=543639 RepID=UPI002100CEDC|nr:uncharacterized protein LOC125946172 [Dermacentor silvarum]
MRTPGDAAVRRHGRWLKRQQIECVAGTEREVERQQNADSDRAHALQIGQGTPCASPHILAHDIRPGDDTEMLEPADGETVQDITCNILRELTARRPSSTMPKMSLFRTCSANWTAEPL